MRTKLIFFVTIASLLFAACAPAPTAPPPEVIKETVVVEQTQVVKQTEMVQVEVTPQPGPNPEAVIPNVEPNAELTVWTFWLSPTFDDYIKSTIARFQEAYPGVKVNWEDHQATFQDDLRNAFAAGNAPDVINLSISEGWVSDYASQGLLLPLDDAVPPDVKALYFSNLWDQQVADLHRRSPDG
jgi:putative chitobiose transport system substrate-binding protein